MDKITRAGNAAELLRVPIEITTALMNTYEEARGEYPAFEVEQAARHVLWMGGDRTNGYEPGGFIHSLLTAWGRADNENNARLRLAFPIYADCKDLMQSQGPSGLMEWAKISERKWV